MNAGHYRSSNAYDYQGAAGAEPLVREQPRRRAAAPERLQRKAARLKELQKRQRRLRRIKMTVVLAAVFACALLVVYRYVMISESGAQADAIRKNYEDVVAENGRLQAQINGSIDLEELEQVAHDRLGMIRPQRDQMFYIDMQNDDRAEVVSADAAPQESLAPVQSVPGMLISTFELLK